jgi:hypothetical protein
MENLDFKIHYIIGKIGVMIFLAELDISYTLWKRLKLDYNQFTIGNIKKINDIYNRLINE